MQVDIPLPGTQTDFHGEDAIDGERKNPRREEMDVKLRQAKGMGQWLTCYARLSIEHRDTAQYQNDYRHTPQITGKKWRIDPPKSDAGHGRVTARYGRYAR